MFTAYKWLTLIKSDRKEIRHEYCNHSCFFILSYFIKPLLIWKQREDKEKGKWYYELEWEPDLKWTNWFQLHWCLQTGFALKNGNAEWSLQLRYLKYPRNHRIVPAWPHLFDNICVGFCNFTLHAQRVGEVQLLQIRVPQEVLSQWWRVTQTLQGKNTQFSLRKAFCKSYVTECSAIHDLWPVKLSS